MSEPDCKITVGIYLKGDDLNPVVVSRELGVVPSEAQYRGEQRTTSTGHQFTKKFGMWAVVSDIDSPLLADHIRQVVSILLHRRKKLDAATGVQQAYVDVFIAVSLSDDGGGTLEFDLTPDDLGALHQIGLPVRLTLSL